MKLVIDGRILHFSKNNVISHYKLVKYVSIILINHNILSGDSILLFLSGFHCFHENDFL